MESTTPTTITLDTFYVSEDDQTASGPGAADTALITLVSTTDPSKVIKYPTTELAEITALVPGSVWTQILTPATSTTAPSPASAEPAAAEATGSQTEAIATT